MPFLLFSLISRKLDSLGPAKVKNMLLICFSCGQEILILERVGRRESCDHCGADLHCCKNCEFYDLSAYNECRESSAERVLDKEKSNFCDQFELRKKGS